MTFVPETFTGASAGPGGARIDLRDVQCRLNGRAVLSGVTVSLTERRIGLVGRNGSGKTTLARLMAGLIRPDAGTVRFDSVDVAGDRRAAIRTVGILFQNPDHQIIFPTVEEELAFGLRQLGRSRDAARDGAREMLVRFGKAHWAPRATAELSQGQRHLVCLMAVLAMEPAVIILDEPFTGLDIPTTRQLRHHLAQVTPTVVQITHDPQALAGYDRVLWLEDGKLRRDGPAAETLAQYRVAMEEDGDAGADLLD